MDYRHLITFSATILNGRFAMAFALFVGCMIPSCSFAQATPSPDKKGLLPLPYTMVTLNPLTGIVSGDVPFDYPFVFTGELKKTGINKIELRLSNNVCGCNSTHTVSTWERTTKDEDAFKLTWFSVGCITFLQPFRKYDFSVVVTDSTGHSREPVSFRVIPRTGVANHAKLDFGLGYAFAPKALVAVTTVHFYFTALNDDTDLKHIHGIRSFFLRTSLFVGISPLTLASDTEQPMQGRYSVGSLVFGIGIRSPLYPLMGNGPVARALLQPMRIHFGEMLYRQADANPAIPLSRNKLSPYIGLTYDLNLSSVLGPVGKLIGGL